jgi:serine acetyltransferase
VGADTIVDAYVRIEGGARIGQRVVLTHRATVGARADVGDDAVIGGFVSERCLVGAGARVFGKLIHRHVEPQRGWDAPTSEEPSPVIEPGGFVGFDAQVIGPVVIGERAYVCAGAIVTRDVPARHIASGVNRIVPYEEWPGDLSASPFFR